MKSLVFLSLGANIGNRENTVMQAMGSLALEDLLQSKMYETQPWRMDDAPWFLNCVVAGFTTEKAQELFAHIKRIEKDLGRVRSPKSKIYESRLIDIDILFYGNSVLKTPELTIPHPLIFRRRFVLVPLAELAPDFIHPVLQKPMSELLKECPDTSIVRAAP